MLCGQQHRICWTENLAADLPGVYAVPPQPNTIDLGETCLPEWISAAVEMLSTYSLPCFVTLRLQQLMSCHQDPQNECVLADANALFFVQSGSIMIYNSSFTNIAISQDFPLITITEGMPMAMVC